MLRFILGLMVVWTVSGCTDSLLSRSDEAAPVWASKVSFEKEGRRYFTGKHEGAYHLEWGKNEARLAALRQVAVELELELTDPLVMVRLADEKDEYAGIKMLDASGEPVLIHHFREDEEYHERWRRKGKKLHDVYVLVSFPVEALEEARKGGM